jgi:K+-sensing histidine kinase KdpD
MPVKNPWTRRTLRVIASVGIVIAIILIEFHYHTLRNSTVTYSLLLAILFFAVRWGRLEAIVASVVAALGDLYYFQEPVGSLKATDPQSYVAVAGFLLTAIIVSHTALKARRRAAEALERKRETERLYELGQAMLTSDSLQTTVWIAINQTIPIFGVAGAAFYVPAANEIHRAGEAGAITDEAMRATAAAKSNYADKVAGVSIIPIKMSEELVGSLGLCGAALSETVLNSIGNLIAVVMDRVRAGERLLIEKQVSESLLLTSFERRVWFRPSTSKT